MPMVMGRKERWLLPLLLLTPAFALMIVIVAYPLFQAVRLSFFKVSLLRPDLAKPVWFDNYLRMFKNEVFYRAFLNSLIWIGGCVSIQFVVGLFGALLLRCKFPGRALVRGLTLIPWATSSVLVALMWTWMLDGNYGVINDLLTRFGILSGYVPWLAQPNTALWGVIIANVWQGAPFFAVMLLAAMQNVPAELYEAAYIDGAGRVKQFFYVTLPLIMPTIIITTMLRLIWTANYMDLILIMTGGGPGYSSMTMPLLAYITAYKRLRVGEAASIAVFQAIFLIVAIGVYLRILQGREKEEMFIA
ncbi:carbohydrate ABC transporter permease [Atrimonas thermophila]|uniref:carbohydrate ABC transporter permease n=1 Tax=Atrimonas thermophila TaxID=3064161 RepID=UPI00399C5C8F